MKRVLCFIILLMGLPAFILAETYWGGELPNITNTKLKSEVLFADGVYTYACSITSGSTNTGKIWSFDIDVRKPEGGIDLTSEGLVNGPGYARHSSALILSSPTNPKMIPVGLWSPSNWISGLSVLGQAGWGGALLQPGQSLSGFHMTSRGLPGIRDFIIEPKLIPPSEESDITHEQIQEVEDQVAFKGKTLGPTAPLVNFVALDFLSYLIDLKHQAAELGWITNPGVEDSLDVKLNKVKAKLQAGDTKTASNILNAFLSEVAAQGCETYGNCPNEKHLSPEAWGLLYFNGKYLLDKLSL